MIADWTSAKWLWWIGLYLGMGVMVPWIMTRVWAHQNESSVRPNAKKLFERGELGLVGLTLAISVIWNLQVSQYSAPTIAVGSILLAVGGIMAVAVWIESHCRQSAGAADDPQRAWSDSFSLALFVFSVAIGVEILLDRLAEVT
jgi:ABC-type tungstate transport system substrate-binding protein